MQKWLYISKSIVYNKFIKQKGCVHVADLTSKELTFLEDSLVAEQFLVSKYNNSAMQATDPTLSSKLKSIADKHQRHYNNLVSHLK